MTIELVLKILLLQLHKIFLSLSCCFKSAGSCFKIAISFSMGCDAFLYLIKRYSIKLCKMMATLIRMIWTSSFSFFEATLIWTSMQSWFLRVSVWSFSHKSHWYYKQKRAFLYEEYIRWSACIEIKSNTCVYFTLSSESSKSTLFLIVDW